jgi:transketolase C-terminal domain/subunit
MVEEHSIHGGQSARCSALCLEHGVFRRFKIFGIPDEHQLPSQEEIRSLRDYSGESGSKALILLDKEVVR